MFRGVNRHCLDSQQNLRSARGSDEMHIRMVNGAKIYFAWDKVLPATFHHYTLAFATVITVAMMILQPYDDLHKMPLWQSTPVYFSGFLIAHGTNLAFCSGAAVLLPKGEVSLNLITFLSTIFWTWAADQVSFLAGGDRLDLIELAAIFPFNLILTVACAQLFCCFFLPMILAELDDAGEIGIAPVALDPNSGVVPFSFAPDVIQSGDPEPVWVSISDQTFLAHEICYIEAQENYVVVHLANRTLLLRDKISSIADRIPPSFGSLVHRSHWVAWHTIAAIKVAEGKTRISLKLDGIEIPVARGRRNEVLAQSVLATAPI
jgi:hypothetical protein